MKTRISAFLILILFVVFSLTLSSCETSHDVVASGDFTCVANGISINDKISVTVCQAYRAMLGEVVNVTMPGLTDMGFAADDELLVTIASLEATNPPTVTASSVILAKAGPYSGDEYVNPSGYGYGPYRIPELSELSVPDNFPDFEDESLATTLRDYETEQVYRVVRIDGNKTYLASIYGTEADFVIIGKIGIKLSAGGHISLKTSKRYHYRNADISSQSFDMARIDDVISLSVLGEEEIHSAYRSAHAIDKPVIYLYPEKPTVCSLRVAIQGSLTCTYPEHGDNGWRDFTAYPDGTLLFPDGGEYYCLYWEGRAHLVPDFTEGFCVKGSDSADFLRDILPRIGLSPREANEFIIYWLPLLQKNPYNVIAFQDEAYTDISSLEISPTPDSLLRVYMTVYVTDTPVDIAPQTFYGFVRRGFTVVEWGGSIIDEP